VSRSAGLRALKNRQISCLCWESNQLDSRGPSLFTKLTEFSRHQTYDSVFFFLFCMTVVPFLVEMKVIDKK